MFGMGRQVPTFLKYWRRSWSTVKGKSKKMGVFEVLCAHPVS
jgi:hypothetical protein